jgi:hypothetical protein
MNTHRMGMACTEYDGLQSERDAAIRRLESLNRADTIWRNSAAASVKSFECVISWHLKTCALCRDEGKVAILDEVE